MTTQTLLDHTGLNLVKEARLPGGRWSQRKSALFIVLASTLSWALVASPFIFWG